MSCDCLKHRLIGYSHHMSLFLVLTEATGQVGPVQYVLVMLCVRACATVHGWDCCCVYNSVTSWEIEELECCVVPAGSPDSRGVLPFPAVHCSHLAGY